MKNTDNRGNIDKLLLGLLAIVFITLKPTKVINWPWLWVLSPIWIPAAVVLVICIVGALVVFAKGRKKT